MDVVIDTDILSTFCKIGKLGLLQRLFRKSTIIISPSVYKEIRIAMQSGKLTYSPPARFSRVRLDPAERKLANEIHERKELGQGECECIAIAKERKSLFLTNDKHAQREAGRHRIEYLDLPLILREFWKTGILKREEVIDLAREIQSKDNIVFENLELVLE